MRKKLIEKARWAPPYDEKELSVLLDMVEDIKVWTSIAAYCLGFGTVDMTLDDELESGKKVKLTFALHLLVYHTRIFLFLFIVPAVDVPKYLVDPELGRFAEWRLKIGK